LAGSVGPGIAYFVVAFIESDDEKAGHVGGPELLA
jgi:hypothetical protein